jgi:hypothetical protein
MLGTPKEGPTLASEASLIAWVGWVTLTNVDTYIAIEMTPMLKSGQAVSALVQAHAQNRHSVWPSGLTFGRYRHLRPLV